MKFQKIHFLDSMFSLLIVLGIFAYANAHASNSLRAGLPDDTVSEIWETEVARGQVRFNLRATDFGKDFLVWKPVAVGKAAPWQLLRWSKEGSRIVLRSVTGRAEETSPDWVNASIVVATFPLKIGSDGAHSVNVTSLFRKGYPSGWGVGEADARVTFRFETPKVFPKNVVLTLATKSRTAEEAPLRWNFVRLPGNRMEVRKLNPNSAFMHPGFMEMWPFSNIENDQKEVVRRWRIHSPGQSVDSTHQTSSIRIYLAPSMPTRWRSWVKAGAESWNEAFSSAGLGAPVEVVDASLIEGWDYDDIRNSALCWGMTKACGWNIFDPRTGEILQAQIHSTNHALPGALARYIVTMAAVDPRAVDPAFPDDFLGGFLEKTAAHETGHLLGLKDGTYGTFSYSTQQLRDRDWLRTNRFSPSIMNYARFNYVVQPEDDARPQGLLQGIGAADKFWIRWGYSDLDSPDALEGLWNSSGLYRYRRMSSNAKSPYDGIETPGVSDPVAAAQLGWKNVERSIKLIEGVEFATQDHDVAALVGPRELLLAAIEQWRNMNRQVASLVGGKLLDPHLNSSGEPMSIHDRGVSLVNREDQRSAMRHLCGEFFSKTPEVLMEGNLIRRSGLTRSEIEEKIRLARVSVYSSALLTFPDRSRFRVLHEVDEGAGEVGNAGKDFGSYDLLRELQTCVVR